MRDSGQRRRGHPEELRILAADRRDQMLFQMPLPSTLRGERSIICTRSYVGFDCLARIHSIVHAMEMLSLGAPGTPLIPDRTRSCCGPLIDVWLGGVEGWRSRPEVDGVVSGHALGMACPCWAAWARDPPPQAHLRAHAWSLACNGLRTGDRQALEGVQGL